MDRYAALVRAVDYLVLSNFIAAVVILFSLGVISIAKKIIVSLVNEKGDDFAFEFLLGLSIAICLITAVGFAKGFASPVWWAVLFLFCLIGTVCAARNFGGVLRLVVIFNISAIFIPIGVALYGGINVFHDGFTYISLAQWNVDHAFINPVVVDNPMLTQVAMYQLLAFRMGAVNFFSALLSISGEKWAVVVYPVWLQLGVFGGAVGLYCAANALAGKAKISFVWLTAIAMTLGPGVFYFSAQAGFIPQLYGLMGLIGLSVTLVRVDKAALYAVERRALVSSSIQAGIFVSLVIVCYSELAPMAVVMASVYLLYMLALGVANRRLAMPNLIVLVGVVSLTVVLLANYQIYRAYMALKLQSGVIVGWDVWWSASSLLAFAAGVKEGVGAGGARDLATGEMVAMLLLLVLVLFFVVRCLKRGNKEPIILAFAASCAIALLGFFVILKAPTVADSARFQQWGFFKLAGWLAAPLGCLIVAAASTTLASLAPLRWIIILPLAFSIYFDYSNARNQANFYWHIGEKPLDTWADDVVNKVAALSDKPNKCVTINFPDGYGKFRQFASYALYPREIYGKWGNDGYVVHFLDDKYEREREDCIFLSGKDNNNSLEVKAFPKRQDIPGDVLFAGGNYNLEKSDIDTWNWVEKTVRYEVRNTASNEQDVKLTFQYLGLPGNVLTVTVGGGQPQQFPTTEQNQTGEVFLKLRRDVPQVYVDFTFEGRIEAISANDTRTVRGRIMNVRLE